MYIAVGGHGSGVQFHKHSDGWNLQLYGHKRWLFYHPDTMPPHAYPVMSYSMQVHMVTAIAI